MKENRTGIYTAFVILSVFSVIIVRLISVINGVNGLFSAAYATLVALGILFIAYDSYKETCFSNAFAGKNLFRIDIFAALAGAGLFVDFVGSAVRVYNSLSERTALAIAALNLVFSIAASAYFGIMALSLRKEKYDLKKLKLFNLIPLLWAITKMAGLLESADSLKDTGVLLRNLTSVAMLCFLFRLPSEVENEGAPQRLTVFFARANSYLGMLLFFDSVMLVFSGGQGFFTYESAYALTEFSICGFSFFFEKNLISKPTNTE